MKARLMDPLSDFVEESHSELSMRKEKDGVGFCVRAKGGKKAIAKLEKLLGEVLFWQYWINSHVGGHYVFKIRKIEGVPE